MTTRRDLLRSSLYGTGLLGLRALATGVPISLLKTPVRAWADEPSRQRMLIMTASRNGDPFNANCPGSYGEGIVHPDSPDFAPTDIMLGDRAHVAARAWTQLDQKHLDRTCFIHHGTLTNAHGNHGKVMRLMGKVRRNEMMVSFFSKELQAGFGTIQTEPVNVGAPLLSFEGRKLAKLAPRSLKEALAPSNDTLGQLTTLRDAELDRLHALLKEDGTVEQRRLLDRFAQSRREARQISQDLIDRLDVIDGDGPDDQVIAVAVLAAMNVSPVLTLGLRFGADNHTDGDLAKEIEQSTAGIRQIGDLLRQLDELGLGERVVVSGLNVFGRTLSKKGTNGRDHNAHHHVLFMTGAGVKPGVVGGIKPKGKDWAATGIDSKTGTGTDEGDIAYEETLSAVGKTLGAALGISSARLDEEIEGGKVISAALVSASV